MTNVHADLKRRYVALYRVSTTRQGRSGLGLEAQQEAVRRFIGDDAILLDEVTEIASGRPGHRHGLERALMLCRTHNAVLVISRLCRLSRDPLLLLELDRAGVEFVAVDLPHANRLTLRIMAALAEEETRLISERTRAALKARRERGLPMGGNNPRIAETSVKAAAKSASVRGQAAQQRARDLIPIIESLRAEGFRSLSQLASGLNQRGVVTPRSSTWKPQSVANLLRIQEGLDSCPNSQ